jgi:glucose/arabinose dehydrogenase
MMRCSSNRTLSWCASFLLIANVAAAATVPAGFTDTQVAAGLRSPTAMAFAPDGRLFVTEQGGALRVIRNGTLLPAPFVTVTVNSSGERGLLGIAFDPDFTSNNFVYVYYTATTPNVHNRVSRFTASGDVAVAGSERILLDLEPLGATNHNGGAIHFGPDGRLYIAVGENAVPNNAQSLNNRLGKILRINADGSIPEDNPFFNTAAGDNRSIWALGLRNPFTFAFDPLYGAMRVNDVGANSWEEVNDGVAGANYGWPLTEGTTTDPRFRSPVYAYNHSEGCAIAGGTFHGFTRSQFPFRYWGAYFFADLCSGWIRTRLAAGTVATFATGISQPVDLKFGSDGALYYLARGTGSATGIVSRIAFVESAPRITLTANGSDSEVRLSSGSSMQLDFGFEAGSSGPIPAAEVFIGVFTPFGLYWLDAVDGFVPRLGRPFTRQLSTFAPSPLLAVSDVAQLPAGVYLWVVLVDDDVDGAPGGELADFVVTVVSP